MAAIDNSKLVEIFKINPEDIKTKTGNTFTVYKAQCLVKGPDNSMHIGIMDVTKELFESTVPGKYLAEAGLTVNYKKDVVWQTVKLHPWAESKAAPAPAAKAA
jgi:hypothetical protein